MKCTVEISKVRGSNKLNEKFTSEWLLEAACYSVVTIQYYSQVRPLN